MSLCQSCGQPLPETPATPEPEPLDPQARLLALLTPGERERNARNLHELSPARQGEVRQALGLKVAKA